MNSIFTANLYSYNVRKFNNLLGAAVVMASLLSGVFVGQIAQPCWAETSGSAIEGAPKTAGEALENGKTLLMSGYTLQAVEMLSKALEMDKKLGQAYALRGKAYGVLLKDDLAVKDYTQAIAADDKDPLNYCGRANANIGLGQYDPAIEDCAKALALDPKCVSAYFSRALAYSKKGDSVSAVADYNKAIEVAPEQRLYAVFPLSAMSDYNKAIAANPKDAKSLGYRGIARLIMGNTTEGNQDLQECYKLAPDLKASFDKIVQEVNSANKG